MRNKWLTIAKIQKIKDDQEKLYLVYKNRLKHINSLNLKLAAAQVLENHRNLNLSNTMWDTIKSRTVVRLFEKIDLEIDNFAKKRSVSNKLNFVGLNKKNQIIVLDDGEESIWKISPIDKKVKVPLRPSNYINNIKSYEDKVSNLIAMNFALEILDEINFELSTLIGKNNLIQYSYCLHSFQIDVGELNKKSCIGYLPFIMKYIKVASF